MERTAYNGAPLKQLKSPRRGAVDGRADCDARLRQTLHPSRSTFNDSGGLRHTGSSLQQLHIDAPLQLQRQRQQAVRF